MIRSTVSLTKKSRWPYEAHRRQTSKQAKTVTVFSDRRQVPGRREAFFSTSKSVTEVENATVPDSLQNGFGPKTAALESITRHGSGDGVIVLNVGGKEFMTLRSTIAANPVLAEFVSRAEANQEFTSNGSAVFIDRNPAHFGIILAFLRNKAEGITFSKTSSFQHKGRYVQLPKDRATLRDLYLEATHFKIDELQKSLCEESVLALIASWFTGGNPFEAASSFLKNLRRGVLAFGGLGSFAVGMQQDWLNLLSPLGLKREQPSETKPVPDA